MKLKEMRSEKRGKICMRQRKRVDIYACDCEIEKGGEERKY